MMKHFFICLLCFSFISIASVAAIDDPNSAGQYAPNRIIVKFHANAADGLRFKSQQTVPGNGLKFPGSLQRLNRKYKLKKAAPLFENFKKNQQKLQALLKKDKSGLSKKQRHILRRLERAPRGAKVPALDRIYKLELELDPGQSLAQAIAEYDNDPSVEYAEPDHIVSVNLIPNDPKYSSQWALPKIDAPQAWDITTGSSDVIVAVVDTGVHYTHSDIDDNIWTNPDEIAANGIDDDENGFIDDIYGYDFINDDADPTDDNGHGTHCAGIIAAEINNSRDVAGLCPDAQIMALKFLGSNGGGYTSDAVKCFYYAVENGADITSNSWGGSGHSNTVAEAIDYAHARGVTMVAAAGNEYGSDPYYPAYYDHMIAVAATMSNDQKAGFSNYGSWVDIAAPGVGILSLRWGGGTTYKSGTSMACPHVAGACALLLSLNPQLGPDELEQTLEESAEPIAAGVCASGRLNINQAVLTVLTSQGKVLFDNDYYSCSDTITVRLLDLDLKALTAQQVTIETDAGDFETLLLPQIASAGVFEGTIQTNGGPAVIADGIIQLSDGATLIASYNDPNDGSGNPVTVTDTATADCLEPDILDIHVGFPGREPHITIQTDEPTMAQILYGTTCGGPYTSEDSGGYFAATNIVKLTGLTAETQYFFVVKVTDQVGNPVIDDNSGACYNFTTVPANSDVHVPAQCTNIQEAIDNCWDGRTVWVADGIYTGDGNRGLDFRGRPITVRSENGPENCIIDCQAGPADQHAGFIFQNDEDPDSVLAGLAIKNAYADFGAAVLCFGACPVIKDCHFTNCTAFYVGGAIYCEDVLNNDSCKILNCTFTNNHAGIAGGAIELWESAAVIDGCLMTDNTAELWGGAVNFENDNHSGLSATMTNCVITGNSATGRFTGSQVAYALGGGIAVFETSTKIDNCLISDNKSANGWGGGIFVLNFWLRPAVSITNCSINGNSAALRGGGIYSAWGDNTTISNCTISRNSADDWGGGVYNCDTLINNCLVVNNKAKRGSAFARCDGPIINCTFAGNIATHGPTFFWCDSAAFTNCIFWNNRKGGFVPDTAPTGSYNCSGNYGPSGEIIGQDPCFVQHGYWDPNGTADMYDDFWVDGDYHLLPDSNCIDAGDPCHPYDANETDLNGEVRVFGDIIDMGAYEYIPTIDVRMHLAPKNLNCKSKGKWLKAIITLPAGYTPADVNLNAPAVAKPLGVSSQYIDVVEPDQLEIGFARNDFCDAIDEDGIWEIQVVGRLTTGEKFKGTNSIKVSNCP